MYMSEDKTFDTYLEDVEKWRKDPFLFIREAFGMRASEPIDELRGKPITYKDAQGIMRTTILFDIEGRLVYPDLSFYTVEMFKLQGKQFRSRYKGTRLTWQQTVFFEAYTRAVNTFDKDSFDEAKRWITARSGHGIGKTSSLSMIALHFLICFFGAQIGVTSNTEAQLKDIFMKELWKWRNKLPQYVAGQLNMEEGVAGHLKDNITQLDDFVRVGTDKDWFLRARVASDDKPEALAGLHGDFVLIIVDEASGIKDKTYETMKGALTGTNFIVIYAGNPTRNEGEFHNSQKAGMGTRYTQLHFTSRESPIVKEGYIENMEKDYPSPHCTWLTTGKCTEACIHSDEVKIRVDGEFAGTAEMDDKGWIPLLANVNIHFEPERGQIMVRALIGVDPAGQGRDRSIIHVRDSVYLKEVLNEKTSTDVDLARKIETVRDIYNASSNDIAVEAFGIGAKVVANLQHKMGENPVAVLTDKPREETKDRYTSYKMELAWRFREWLSRGGIIITNNQQGWVKELEKIKYKRNLQGKMSIMPKPMFKKEYGFSPDRFDAATMTFYKDEPTMPVVLTKEQLENKDMAEWLQRQQEAQRRQGHENMSSM